MSNLCTDLDTFLSCTSSSDSFVSVDSVASELSSDEDISSIFSNLPSNLNIVHINVQSVPAHYHDLLAYFGNCRLDAILMSESFLKPSLVSAHYVLPGFVLIRNDRTGKGGGGVAIYLRVNIPYKVISVSPPQYSGSSEHLFLEITLRHSKLLLGVYYCPNLNISYFDSFDSLLNDYASLYTHIVIMGDFNTCLLKNDVRSRKLTSVLSSYNLHILSLAATHHSPHCVPSLLDLIIVSSPSLASTHGQLTAPFSYHDLIFLSCDIRPPKRQVQSLLLRNYRDIDLEILQRDASEIDWNPLFSSTCTDEKVQYFNNRLIQLYDRHAPLRRVKLKHVPAPWLTPAIKETMARRDNAKKKCKRSPTDINISRFKILRNRCSRLCRDAKRRHFHSSLTNRKATEVWQFLKSNGIGKSSNHDCLNLDLNSLNQHFSLPPVTLDSETKWDTLQALSNNPLPNCTPFTFSTITPDDAQKSLTAISSTAIGSDNLCSRMLTPILTVVLPILTHIFNHSLSSSSFPVCWKKAYVIPLPKCSSPTLPCNFRPISILPFLSKVLEHIVHRQLSYYLHHNNLLSPLQSGFRAGHSTVTALLKITDDIRWAMENKSLTLLILLDFSSAFNSVNFDILLGTLQSLNVSLPCIHWFDSYLRGRSQRVTHNEVFSDWFPLTAGVPQGGVLSPLLFSVYINSVTRVISSHFHLYADDLQIYRHFLKDEAAIAISALNNDLLNISGWAKSFGLHINPSKSQAIIVGSRYFTSLLDMTSLPDVVLDGSIIAFADTAKNLGVLLDPNLTWSTHISSISSKVYFTFHSLKCLQNFLPIETKILLVQTLILPIIDYADSCYLDANEELLNKLERLQNLCIRFIYSLKKYDRVSHFRKILKWLPIRLRRNSRILCVLYKILYNPTSPSYLRERFAFNHPVDVPCRTHIRSLLQFPSHTTDFYSFSFSVHAVRLWNSLPADIRISDSIFIFKRRVKEFYLSLT